MVRLEAGGPAKAEEYGCAWAWAALTAAHSRITDRLNSAVRLTQPSLSRAVSRLERRGWLRRAGAPDDRRGVLASITPAGREVLSHAAAAHAEAIRDLLLDRLTPDEQELLARALTRVAED